MQVVPTDPAIVRAGPTASLQVIEAIRQELGLNEPLWKQFFIYIGRLLQGDLGGRSTTFRLRRSLAQRSALRSS